VYRGYERFADELFRSLPRTANVVLFKGGGDRADREIVVRGLHRDSRLASALGQLRGDRFFWEAVSFGVMAWPNLLRRGVELLHYSEPPLNNLFSRLEKLAGRGPRRLFSHALGMDPTHCLGCHHLHQTSPVAYERARDIGVPDSCMTLLPYGLETSRFMPPSPELRRELRAHYRLPEDVPVVLCVSALNRGHKRVDRLVQAMARLKGDARLLLCGAVEDRTILEEAGALLGDRLLHLYLPPHAMGNAYALADLFVSPSIVEGFGLAIVEAALSGVPPVVNDSPHFRWLLGPRWPARADMTDDESLVAALQAALENLPGLRREIAAMRAELVERFDWSRLVPRYLEMYRRTEQENRWTIADRLAPCR
jgi:glycosyltransferase involved in cell wall biosynthesis